MTYMAKINMVDVTSFNDDTEDWSGGVYTVEIGDTISSNTMDNLIVEIARYFGTSSEDFEQDFDDETHTYTCVEENTLRDYYINFYEMKEIVKVF